MRFNPGVRFYVALCSVFFLFLAEEKLPAAEPSAFESLGKPVRVGGLMGCLAGPDGKGGEALYFNFNQISGALFLVQVNPETGESRQFNAPEGPGAWAQIAASDGNIYLGTWSGALVLKFDPRKPDLGIQVVGKPSPTEDYIWQYAEGKDGKLYGCTYPNAKLVSYDPATGEMKDLGRTHPTEMYARSVAAGEDGWIYVGIGTTVGGLAAYNTATGEMKSIMPAGLEGAAGWATVGVSRREGGVVCAEFGTNLLILENGEARKAETAPNRPPIALRDGRVVAPARGKFTLTDPKTGQSVERTFRYEGAGDHIFMLGQGPGGMIYGSTAMPLEVFRHDPASGKSEHLGAMPGGEVYSMMEQDGRLYLCYYGGAIMNLYDPAKPWKWGSAPESNPFSFGGIGDGHLRPRAMIRGPEGLIYIGSEPPYGELGGALGVWDPAQNKTIENYRNIIPNQSIVSLAWDPESGLIFGGSGNYGGGGTKPTEKEALFFAFDPKAKKKVFETALLPGARNYPAMLAAGGRIFAAAGSKLFVFNSKTMAVEKTIDTPGGTLDISLGLLPDGRIAGLTGSHVYFVDPAKAEIVESIKAPVPVKCGFATAGGAVYFASGAEMWRWLPEGAK